MNHCRTDSQIEAIPSLAIQRMLEAAMERIGETPRVLLLEQEGFASTTGARLLPAIIHAPESQIIRRTQRGQKVIRAVFAVRILSDCPALLDRLHASITAVSEQVPARIDISLVTAARDDELGAYWRVITVAVPGRFRGEMVPDAPHGLRWGGDTRLTWGGDTRLLW